MLLSHKINKGVMKLMVQVQTLNEVIRASKKKDKNKCQLLVMGAALVQGKLSHNNNNNNEKLVSGQF